MEGFNRLVFSYYGSKKRIAKRYPTPLYPTIIEPFAGAAQYSLLYPDRQVWINDLDSTIYDVWKLILSDRYIRIPNLTVGDSLHRYNLNEANHKLLGFAVQAGASQPSNKVTSWAADNRPGRRKKWEVLRDDLERYRPLIQHWRLTNFRYQCLPNVEASWFIDPPYQHGGSLYPEHAIDYGELADWCKSRNGQVIVCENDKADWLPFVPLTTSRTQGNGLATECVYYLNMCRRYQTKQ